MRIGGNAAGNTLYMMSLTCQLLSQPTYEFPIAGNDPTPAPPGTALSLLVPHISTAAGGPNGYI
jgi:hypothetical protein